MSTTSVVLNYPIGSPVGVTDQVTVTGEPDVTGLNVYVSIYKESGSPLEPGTSSIAEWQVPLNSSGMATTPPYIPESAGTFCYQARFIGDDNDTPIATTICEILTVTPFPASLVTVPGTPVTTGSSITLSDAADMTIYPTAPAEGGSGDYGSVVFRLYSDPGCHDLVSATSPAVIAWTGTKFQATGSLTLSALAPGTYYWIAAYPGNYDNLAYTSTCGEPVTVGVGGGAGANTPNLTTQLSSSTATAGSSVTDTATLSLASAGANGAITISMYSGSTCSSLVTSQTATPATDGNGAYSATFTSLTTGSYEFQASFAGDTNDSPATSSCGSEPLSVTGGGTLGANTPNLTTQLSSSTATAGSSVTDTATLSLASVGANGAITISMYSGSTCSSLVTSQTAMPATDGNGAYSATFTSLTAGSYEFQASFAGDTNDSPATSSCGSEPLTVTAVPAGGQLAASVTTPTTGADISGPGLAALLFLFLGSVLLVAGRQVLRIRPQ
ncbi:MAG: hypothetical protein WA724_04725 [Candidatus Dormiibacterota bacterium]